MLKDNDVKTGVWCEIEDCSQCGNFSRNQAGWEYCTDCSSDVCNCDWDRQKSNFLFPKGRDSGIPEWCKLRKNKVVLCEFCRSDEDDKPYKCSECGRMIKQ